MNLIQDIKNDSSFCELNKAGNFLYAYDSVQNILEVDIKHKLIFV